MPHFQSQMPRVLQSRDWFEASFEHAFGGAGAATRRAFEDAGQELPEELQPHAETLRDLRREHGRRLRVSAEAR